MLEKIGRRGIRGCYVGLLAVVLFVCIFANKVSYARAGAPMIWEGWLLLAGAAGLAGIALISRRCDFEVLKKKPYVIWLLSLLLLCLQIYVVRCYYFSSDWDVEILLKAAFGIANGEGPEAYNAAYFSRYPNNLFLMYLFSRIIRFCQWIHVNPYDGIIVFQCVISWATGLLLYGTIRQVFKNRSAAVLGWGIYVLLIGVSPWVVIPYSDSVALVFPIAILYVYSIREKGNGLLRAAIWGCIGVLVVIGYEIKPQVMILLIAIGICEAMRGISQVRSCLAENRCWIRSLMGFALGVCISLAVVHGCTRSLQIEIDPEQAFGWTHFLMMGMNDGPENGTYKEEDVDFSGDCENAAQRKERNLQETRRRLEAMGPDGFWNLMHRKLLTNYNDGTFCWGREGMFFVEKYTTSDSPVAKFVQNLYYTGPWQGAYYKYFYSGELALWLGILFWSIWSAFLNVKEEPANVVTVIMLAVIGLTIFEQLFEPRARYFYIYAPMYICLAVAGMQRGRRNNR